NIGRQIFKTSFKRTVGRAFRKTKYDKLKQIIFSHRCLLYKFRTEEKTRSLCIKKGSGFLSLASIHLIRLMPFSLIAVNLSHFLHIAGAQFKIKYIKVFFNPRWGDRFRNDDIAILHMPAENHLCRCLTVLFSQLVYYIIRQHLTAGHQWAIGL